MLGVPARRLATWTVLSLALACFGIVAASGDAWAQGDSTSSYDLDFTINADGSVDVVENIVFSIGSVPRLGR